MNNYKGFELYEVVLIKPGIFGTFLDYAPVQIADFVLRYVPDYDGKEIVSVKLDLPDELPGYRALEGFPKNQIITEINNIMKYQDIPVESAPANPPKIKAKSIDEVLARCKQRAQQ